MLEQREPSGITGYDIYDANENSKASEEWSGGLIMYVCPVVWMCLWGE